MAENKNKLDPRATDLKRADADKSDNIGGITAAAGGADFLKKEKRMREKARGETSTVQSVGKRKFPIAADIAITFLTVALVVGVIFGARFLLNYFAFDYEEKTVIYTVVVDKENAELLSRGNDVYCDDGENTAFLGIVQSVSSNGATDTDHKTVTVKVDARYRSDEGYSSDAIRIAVNQSLVLRSGMNNFDAVIVEIQETE